ncbi:Hypothetical predicted protein, partial [Paramuricea clavata]
MAYVLGATLQQGEDDTVEIIQDCTSSSTTDTKLSEEQNFNLFKKLEVYPCLWDSSKVAYQNKAQRQKATAEICEMFNLLSATFKR